MIEIGPFSFKNWGDASKFAKEVLNKHRLGEEVTNHEKDFLIAALHLRGQRGLEKIGCGVRRIWVDNNEFSGRGFFLERIDGSITEFSYLKCFSGHTRRAKKSQHLKDIEAACRTAILRDKPFKDDGECHAHHEGVPFKDLVGGFLKEHILDPRDIEIDGYQDMRESKQFKDPALAEAFRDYHQRHARIEVISIEEHRSRHRTLKR